MQTAIHPSYQQITFTCACGNSFVAGSTLSNNLRVEICSHCHPLYTGKSKLVDTAGRVDKFQARQEQALKRQAEADARSQVKAQKAADSAALAAEIELAKNK
jgi:large subunit ribosomal protein L31